MAMLRLQARSSKKIVPEEEKINKKVSRREPLRDLRGVGNKDILKK